MTGCDDSRRSRGSRASGVASGRGSSHHRVAVLLRGVGRVRARRVPRLVHVGRDGLGLRLDLTDRRRGRGDRLCRPPHRARASGGASSNHGRCCRGARCRGHRSRRSICSPGTPAARSSVSSTDGREVTPRASPPSCRSGRCSSRASCSSPPRSGAGVPSGTRAAASRPHPPGCTDAPRPSAGEHDLAELTTRLEAIERRRGTPRSANVASIGISIAPLPTSCIASANS